MSEQKLGSEYARGQEAKELLENPLLLAAFNEIEEGINRQWKQSKASDADAREKLYLMQRLLQNLKAGIQEHITTGKMAETQLIQLKEKRTLASVIGLR